jgi:hypothetical protein
MVIIDKRHADIDARLRSLLQKAVRRGNVELVLTTSALLESLSAKEKNWFRNRTAVITFEECWPLGTDLVFNRKYHSKVAALIKVTRSVKAKDAAGLGFLANALFEGDLTVFSGTPEDRHIKIIANAIRRPEDFWDWLDKNAEPGNPKALIENAKRFKNVGRRRDKAVVQAAAYLAAFTPIPQIEPVEQADKVFPYWIALDMHTPQGRRVLKDVARDLHISPKQLQWSMFYFEGAKTNAAVESNWWQRSCEWYFQKTGLPMAEAHLIWEPAKPQVIEALADESRQLHRELYTWKLANLERIDNLKKKVELFSSHFDSGHLDQLELF